MDTTSIIAEDFTFKELEQLCFEKYGKKFK